jgi:hypothetical protein
LSSGPKPGDNPLYHPASAGARRYHPGMAGDLERLPAPISPAAPSAGPAVLAAELPGRFQAELSAVGGLGELDQVLVSAWLTGLRSARTRGAYTGDVVAWLCWLAGRGTGALAAGWVHVDLWAAT